MAVGLDEAAAWVAAYPEVTETVKWHRRTWEVRGKSFAWERPLTKADVKRLGDRPAPAGPILAVRTEDLGEKEAILAAGTKGVFTIEHFDGFPAYLIQLDVATKTTVREAILDAWLAVAPEPLARQYLGRRTGHSP